MTGSCLIWGMNHLHEDLGEGSSRKREQHVQKSWGGRKVTRVHKSHDKGSRGCSSMSSVSTLCWKYRMLKLGETYRWSKCWNWEKLADDPNPWFARNGMRGHRASTQYNCSVKAGAVFQVPAVRTSVPRALLGLPGFKGGGWHPAGARREVHLEFPLLFAHPRLNQPWPGRPSTEPQVCAENIWSRSSLPEMYWLPGLVSLPFHPRRWSMTWGHTSFWPGANSCVSRHTKARHLALGWSLQVQPSHGARTTGRGWLSESLGQESPCLLLLAVDP